MISLQFNNLKGKELFSYILLLSALFLPGFMFLYLTNIELFNTLEATKLIILSIVYSLPLIFIWLIDSIYGENNLLKKGEKQTKELTLIDAGLKTALSGYIFILALYLKLNMYLNYPDAVIFYGLPIFLTIVDIIDKIINNIKKRKKLNNHHPTSDCR